MGTVVKIFLAAVADYLLNIFIASSLAWGVWNTFALKTGLETVGFDVIALALMATSLLGFSWGLVGSCLVAARKALAFSKLEREMEKMLSDQKSSTGSSG